MYYFFTDKITNIIHNYNKQTTIFYPPTVIQSIYFIENSASDCTDQDKYLWRVSNDASKVSKVSTCLLEERLFSILVNINFEISYCRSENLDGT